MSFPKIVDGKDLFWGRWPIKKGRFQGNISMQKSIRSNSYDTSGTQYNLICKTTQPPHKRTY